MCIVPSQVGTVPVQAPSTVELLPLQDRAVPPTSPNPELHV